MSVFFCLYTKNELAIYKFKCVRQNEWNKPNLKWMSTTTTIKKSQRFPEIIINLHASSLIFVLYEGVYSKHRITTDTYRSKFSGLFEITCRFFFSFLKKKKRINFASWINHWRIKCTMWIECTRKRTFEFKQKKNVTE